jgi:hypothetical protein
MVEQTLIKQLGYIPDLPDHRDLQMTFPGEFLEKSLPPSVNLISLCPPIYDQGQLGSCTGNSIAGAIEFDRIKQGLSDFNPSRLFIYYNERVIEGTVGTDSGAMIRDGVKVVNKLGAPSETVWPYDISKFSEKPSTEAFEQGSQHPAVQYSRVPRSLAFLKACLASGFPFVFGFSVYESFMNQETARTGIVNLPGKEERLLGGHAVLACFTGDTKISLLDGREESFKNLINEPSFWVYSSDENGNIVPGLAHSVRKTGKKEIMKIKLDNEQDIECTEEHLFLMREGMYKKAIDLNIGDSLMPLYRKKSKTKGMSGYDMIWSQSEKKYNYTHRKVYSHLNGSDLPEVIHHCDFNKLNNSPDNLVGMTWNDHTNLHNEQVKLLEKYAKSDSGRTKSRDLMSALWSNPEWKAKTLLQNRNNGEKTKYKAAILRCKKRPSIKQYIIREVQKRDELMKRAVENIMNYNRRLLPPNENQIQARKTNAIKLNQQRWNHKIIGIERTGRTEDVYDLTVDKYHNFALSAGVFVHNCGYDDTVQRFTVRNSWGVNWGQNGYFSMPYEYLLNSNLSDDMWKITLVK